MADATSCCGTSRTGGYALPTKRRHDGESYQHAAERTAEVELGLNVGTDITLTPANDPFVPIDCPDYSRSVHTNTFYWHGVFTGTPADSATLKSEQPLVWADLATILSRRITGKPRIDGPGDAPDARVSQTVTQILLKLNIIEPIDLLTE